jgi:RNA polymerase sigma factor (sigma-70 family)
MLASTPLPEAAPGSRGIGAMEGDPIDIEDLYARYMNALLAYIYQKVPNRTEAEDIAAETFAAALIALPRFRGDCSPYAWLLGIARQKVAEAARRRDRHPELLDADLTERERSVVSLLSGADMGPLPEEAVLHAEARGIMRQLLDRLPEPQREALLLQSGQGLSIREIAHVMGRSVAATNSLLERARATIFRLGQGYFVG